MTHFVDNLLFVSMVILHCILPAVRVILLLLAACSLKEQILLLRIMMVRLHWMYVQIQSGIKLLVSLTSIIQSEVRYY